VSKLVCRRGINLIRSAEAVTLLAVLTVRTERGAKTGIASRPTVMRFRVKCHRSKFALKVDASRNQVRVLSHPDRTRGLEDWEGIKASDPLADHQPDDVRRKAPGSVFHEGDVGCGDDRLDGMLARSRP
jgi:hypothetical protein